MNSNDPIARWRAAPVLLAQDPRRGWQVVFAMQANNSIPVLDYFEGRDVASDPEFPFDQNHLERIMGLINQIQFSGPLSLGKYQFTPFVGNDAADGMCELSLKKEQGHRILCFRQSPQRLLLATAFRKPPQRATPEPEKDRARAVKASHELRLKTQAK